MAIIADALTTITGRRGRITAEKITGLYRKGTDDIRQAQLSYRINSSYVDNPRDESQWVWVPNGTNQLTALSRNPRRVRVTVSRVGPESRRIMAKLLKRPLVFEVPPDAPDAATIRAARTSEAVLSHTAEDQKWNRYREELAWSVWKGGTAGLCLDWDTTAGRSLGIDPVTNRPVGTGDIRVSVLSIAEIATEAGTRDIERAAWWIKAQVLPPGEVKRIYRMAKEPGTDANATTLAMRSSTGSNRPSALTLVLTYYERPNPENTNGTVAVIVGNDVVDGPHPWPFPFTDRLNIVCARETMIEGQWYGKTVITDVVPMQTFANHIWTNLGEHVKQAGNARLQATETSRDLVSNLDDEPGKVVLWRDQPHQYLSPPTLPNFIENTMERLNAAMDDAMGQHDISRGSAPANIQSGIGLSILQEQDDTPTGKLAQTLADAFGDLGTLVLKTYEKKVRSPESRTAVVSGAIAEKVVWDGDALMGQVYAHVPYDAVAPMNEAARFARLQFYVQAGMITSPQAASAYMDVPGMGGAFIEGIDPDVAKARRENHLLMFGEPTAPASFDDHAKHIAEHNDERKSARYERASPDRQKLLDLHIQGHSTMAAEEMGHQVLKGQFAPALGAAAQADQPPGSAVPPPSSSPQANLGAGMGGAPEASSPPENQMPPLGIPTLP